MPQDDLPRIERSIPLPWAIGATLALAAWLITIGGDIRSLRDLPVAIQTMQVSLDQVRKDMTEWQLKQRETLGDVQRLKNDLSEFKADAVASRRDIEERLKDLERRRK